MSRWNRNRNTGEETLVAGSTFFNIVAPKEISPATQAWTVGKHILYNGVVYVVIRAISVGDDLVYTGNTPNIAVADYLENQIDTLKEALTTEQSNIAYINTNSTTASKAYAADEQFILDGVLRKAKTAITSGATLVLNSNYENANSVTSQIKSLITTGDFTVDTVANQKKVISSSSDLVYGTLPSSPRKCCFVSISASNSNDSISICVTGTGDIIIVDAASNRRTIKWVQFNV